GLWLVPLLLLPAVAVYHGARLSLEKEHRSRHDALTELPNRLFFAEAAASAIATGARHRRCVAIMMMDLDSFKELNDTLGHSKGDELLRQLGSRLGPVLQDGQVLARLGGDEFGIRLPDIETAYDAKHVAASLLRDLAG